MELHLLQVAGHVFGKQNRRQNLALAHPHPGDNVLIPSLGYPLYAAVLARFEAEERMYRLDESNGWQPDVESVRSLIDERTRALVIINPNNPTGSVTSEPVLRELIEIAVEHNLKDVGEPGLAGRKVQLLLRPGGSEQVVSHEGFTMRLNAARLRHRAADDSERVSDVREVFELLRMLFVVLLEERDLTYRIVIPHG